MNKPIVVGGETVITCRNAIGKVISLPAAYLYRAIADGRGIQKMDGNPLHIARRDNVALTTVATNCTSWHNFTVAGDVPLSLWTGGSVAAGKAKGQQLKGECGMYCVTSIAHSVGEGFVGEFESVGGVYVC